MALTTRNPEVVAVVTGSRLIDSVGQEAIYSQRRGRGLDPGFYVVLLPVRQGAPRFGDEAEFVGPFATQAEARANAHALANPTSPPDHRSAASTRGHEQSA